MPAPNSVDLDERVHFSTAVHYHQHVAHTELGLRRRHVPRAYRILTRPTATCVVLHNVGTEGSVVWPPRLAAAPASVEE